MAARRLLILQGVGTPQRSLNSVTGPERDARGMGVRALALAVSCASFSLAGMTLVMPGSAHAAETASQSAAREYAIAPGALSDVLAEFAATAGVQLVFEPRMLAGVSSAGLQGAHSVQDGFARLLAGSGYQLVEESGDAYSLRAVATDAHNLPAVTVTGNQSLGARTEGTGSYTTGATASTTGLNLSLRETPQSVTVITRQRMEDQGLESIGSVLTQTPGISHSQGGGYGGYSYVYSRGYLINNFDVDGLPAGGALSMGNDGYHDISSLETAIYDSVTVVRGASGLLHGSGDPSGSVSLTRKRPTREFQASVEAGLGSWDKRRAVGDISGPLNSSGSVRGRLVAVYDESESWVDRYEGDRNVFYGVVEADLTDDTLIMLTLDHQDVDSRGDVPTGGFPVLLSDGSLAPFSVSDNPATDWSRYSKESTSVSARVEHRFNEDWQGVMEYSQTRSENTAVYGSIGTLEPDGTAGIFFRHYPREQDWQAFNAKLNGSYSFFGREHDLVVGYNRENSEFDSSLIRFVQNEPDTWPNWSGDFPEPDWSTYATNPTEQKTQQDGIYLATRLRATDDLSLILGTRVSNWETRTKSRVTGSVTDDREESGVVTPYAAVVYDLTSELSAYASYTEIFNPVSVKDTSGSLLDPEEGSNIELGLKGEWFGGRLNASTAVFQSGKDNLAVQDGSNLTPEGNQAYVAEDDTEGLGWELEVSGEPAPGWHLQGGYTRMVLEDSDGNRLATQNQPKHMFKLFSSWTPASLNRLTVGGGLRWQSEVYDAANPAFRDAYTQESYTVVDLMTRYAFTDQLSLSANLNNAFDKTYRSHLMAYHVYGAPRNLNATLRYQF